MIKSKTLKFLLSGLVIGLMTLPSLPVSGWQYGTGAGWGFVGPCRWGHTVYYYNGASTSDSSEVSNGAAEWSSVNANLNLVQVTNPTLASIRIYSANNGSAGVTGQTFPGGASCSGTGIFSGYMRILLYDNNKKHANGSPYNFGENESVATHEIGHALGFAHSGYSEWNLMYPTDARYEDHHVIGPMMDDIRGAVSIYGESLSYSLTSSNNVNAQTNWPAGGTSQLGGIEVKINSGQQGHALAYQLSTISLPSTARVLSYEIDSKTLYRGSIGFWASTDPTDITKRVANAEIDSDGIKVGHTTDTSCCYSWTTISSTVNANHAYFVELILQKENSVYTEYLFVYDYTANSWVGEGDNSIYNGWGSFYVGHAAWTDSTTNPASDYWWAMPTSVGYTIGKTTPAGNCVGDNPRTGPYGPYWLVSTTGCGQYGYDFYALNQFAHIDVVAVPKNGTIAVSGYFMKNDTLGSLSCTSGGASRSYLDLYVIENSTGNEIGTPLMVISCTQNSGQWYYVSVSIGGLPSGDYVRVAFGRRNSWSADYSLQAFGSEIVVQAPSR